MPQYLYKYALGHDQVSLTNIETLVTYAPSSKPVPLGSVRQRTLNQYVQSNGTRDVKWFWGAMSFTDFDALITELFTDYETENAALTVETLHSDNTYHKYNVVVNRPVEGTDYTRREYGQVEGLTLTLRVINEI